MLKLYVKGQDMISRLMKNEEGASLAEYALLIALVLIGVAVAVNALVAAENTALGAGTGALNAASGAGG